MKRFSVYRDRGIIIQKHQDVYGNITEIKQL